MIKGFKQLLFVHQVKPGDLLSRDWFGNQNLGDLYLVISNDRFKPSHEGCNYDLFMYYQITYLASKGVIDSVILAHDEKVQKLN